MTGLHSNCRHTVDLLHRLEEGVMSSNDSVNGRVTIHAGTRYGGKAQHSYDYYRNENCDTLVERTKKFSVQKDTSVRMDAVEITSASVNAEKIQ